MYKEPVINYSKVRKSQTVPDQSMSIREIVRRYVRGIPVDVVRREGVYIDQQNDDLEKLSRMDFGEKAEYAQAMASEANRLKDEHTEAVRRSKEERAERARLKALQAEVDKKSEQSEQA